MCGICGILYYGRHDRITPPLLARMRDTLAHRGPDDEGLWVSEDGRVGLGFRRLAIIDLSPAANQPMTNEDGTLRLVYNGEIYNHRKLRAVLERLGHTYHSHSDTETILHAYEEWGIEAIQRFEGMFAFVLWDHPAQALYLVRDRVGVKPLYYTFMDGAVIFGSEIKALLAFPGMSRDIDSAGLYHYLTFLVTPAPLTMFRGIYKLPAGHWLRIDAQGRIRIEQYWDAIAPPSEQPHTEAGCIDTIRRLFTEAVVKRMMSDVPFGVFLSGGLDSSLNVALMNRVSGGPVNTFSVGFRDHPRYNEFGYARRVAEMFRTNHREVVISHQELVEYVSSMIHHQDEPLADWVCVPLYFVSRLARDSGVIVVQVGEGSDEQFCGYPHYRRALRLHRSVWPALMRTPRVLRRLLASSTGAAARATGRGLSNADVLARAAREEELFWGGAISFREMAKSRILHRDRFRPAPSLHPTFQSASALGYGLLHTEDPLTSHSVVTTFLERLADHRPSADYLEKMIYLEFKHRLPELLLMRVDKVTMSTSVEARVPYLDHALVEYTMGIPEELKVRNGTLKHLLKQAATGIIPDEIIHRRKQGFAAPIREWFQGALGTYMETAIMHSRLHEREFFRSDHLRAMIDRHRRGRDHSLWLWTIFNLSQWYDYWIA